MEGGRRRGKKKKEEQRKIYTSVKSITKNLKKCLRTL